MLAGGIGAVMAVLAGHSVLFGLAVYSGGGTACALLIGIVVAARAALAAPKPGSAAPDATAA